MIINTETLKLESPRQIRQATGIPLPRNPDTETLAQLDPPRAYVVETEPPVGDVVEPNGYEKGEDGAWRQAWSVRDYTETERAEQLDQARGAQLSAINDAYQEELDAILHDYPEAETKTWDKQESEARAWQSDNATSTPLIDAIATSRGMGKAELVSRIIAKADAWVALSGAATGKRQALEDQVAQSATLEAVEAITW